MSSVETTPSPTPLSKLPWPVAHTAPEQTPAPVMAKPEPAPSQEPVEENPRLTQREREVLGLLARGLSYAEAGDILHVSINTIRTHVRALYGKLDARNKREAADNAVRLGLM